MTRLSTLAFHMLQRVSPKLPLTPSTPASPGLSPTKAKIETDKRVKFLKDWKGQRLMEGQDPAPSRSGQKPRRHFSLSIGPRRQSAWKRPLSKSWVWWLTPIIPAVRKMRQEDHCEFPSQPKLHSRTLFQKPRTKATLVLPLLG